MKLAWLTDVHLNFVSDEDRITSLVEDLDNLEVFTGGARYGDPQLQPILNVT